MVVSGFRCEFTLVVVRLAGRWAEKLLGFYPVMGLGIKVTPGAARTASHHCVCRLQLRRQMNTSNSLLCPVGLDKGDLQQRLETSSRSR